MLPSQSRNSTITVIVTKLFCQDEVQTNIEHHAVDENVNAGDGDQSKNASSLGYPLKAEHCRQTGGVTNHDGDG